MNVKRFLAGVVVINSIVAYDLTPLFAFGTHSEQDNITKSRSPLSRPRNCTFNGTLKDRANGKELSNIEVEFGGEVVKTNKQGSFTFRRVVSGEYSLDISKNGYYSAYTTKVDVKNTLEQQEYYLAKKEVTFKGSVKDDVKGNLLTKATIKLDAKTVQTDSKGNFSFGKMQAGTYKLNISREGYVPYSTTVSIAKDSEKQYSIAKKKIHTFKGTIKNLDDEQSVANVDIKIGDFSTKTDKNGNFVLNNIPEKRYSMTIVKEGYKTYKTEVRVEDDLTNQYYIIKVINLDTKQFNVQYPSETAFIEKIIPSVSKIYTQTGIPWQVMLAQVCLESGYGKYEIVDSVSGVSSKNLFGIKYFGDMADKRKYVQSWTHEEINPKELSSWKKSHPELVLVGTKENKNLDVTILGTFAKYDTYDNAFDSYKKVLLNDYFKHALRNANDPLKYIKDVQSLLPGESHPRYALDGKYVEKIEALMKKWKMIP